MHVQRTSIHVLLKPSKMAKFSYHLSTSQVIINQRITCRKP